MRSASMASYSAGSSLLSTNSLLEDRPCLMLFCEDLARPSSVLVPLDRAPLMRAASARRFCFRHVRFLDDAGVRPRLESSMVFGRGLGWSVVSC